LFANAVVEEADGQSAIVFIQDYHFALLSRMIKRRNPLLTVAQFWHIPWPSCHAFSAFPWKEELVDGMLGNDLIGFHIPEYCNHFADTVDRVLGMRCKVEDNAVRLNGHDTVIRAFPISTDFEAQTRMASGP